MAGVLCPVLLQTCHATMVANKGRGTRIDTVVHQHFEEHEPEHQARSEYLLAYCDIFRTYIVTTAKAK